MCRYILVVQKVDCHCRIAAQGPRCMAATNGFDKRNGGTLFHATLPLHFITEEEQLGMMIILPIFPCFSPPSSGLTQGPDVAVGKIIPWFEFKLGKDTHGISFVRLREGALLVTLQLSWGLVRTWKEDWLYFLPVVPSLCRERHHQHPWAAAHRIASQRSKETY